MATGGVTYPSTKERSNYARLCRVIVDLGSDVVRDALNNLVVPSQLLNKVHKCVDFTTRITAAERQKINTAVANASFKEFDISFTYKLINAVSVQDLRHELSITIPASNILTAVQNNQSLRSQLSREQEAMIKFSVSHGDYSECDCYLLTQLLSKLTSSSVPNIIPSVNKWGGNGMPKITDVTLGDDIERIRLLRNKLYGHVNDTCVSDAEFQLHWTEISGIIHRMDQHLKTGGRYLKDLNDIEVASLDDKWDVYVSEIERQAKYEQELEVKLEKQEKSVESLQTRQAKYEQELEVKLEKQEKSIESLQTNVSFLSKNEQETKDRLENQEDSIEQLQKDSGCIHRSNKEIKVALEKQMISTVQLQTDVASLNTSENKTQLLLQKQEESTERIQADLATSETEIKCKLENYELSTLKIETDVDSLNRGVTDIGGQVGELRLEIDKQQQSSKEIQEQVTVHGKQIAQLSQEKDNPVPLNIQEQNKMVADLWTEEDIVFIETRATKQALDLIDKNNVLSVIGNAGTGKSATIHHIALQLKSKGYDILEVHSPSDIKSYLNPNSKQVFIIDDPVGVHSLDYERLSTWIRYDNRLHLCLSKGDHKLLCSIRTQVANEPDFEREKTLLNEININLQDEACFLTDKEKIKILQQHLKKNKFGDHNQIVSKIKIVLKDTLKNFPLICKLFTSKEEFQKYGIEFFKHPFSFILEDLTAMKRGDKRKYCALVMCFVNNNHLDLNDFDVFNSKGIDEKFKSVMKACGVNKNEFCGTLGDNVVALSGVYLKQEGEIFKFNHDLIYDVVAFNFGQQYPKQMIEFSPSRFLCERVSLDENVVSQEPYVLSLDSEYYDPLMKRLVSDLERDEHDFATKNKCWDNRIFMNVFIKEFEEHKGKICKLFCKNIKQNQEYMDKVKLETMMLNMYDSSQLWSWKYVALNLQMLPDITPLHLMVMYAHRDFFECIWQNMSSENKINVNSNIPLLHYACFGGDKDICTSILLDTGCSVNFSLDCEQTIFGFPVDLSPLHFASFSNTDVIELLLSRGANINAASQRNLVAGNTAITFASGSGNLDNAYLLINKGADINSMACPLLSAAMNNHVNIVQLLCRHDANIDIKRKATEMTALMHASSNGYNEIVQILLSHKASVDMQNNAGLTALMMASHYGHNEIVQLLLSHKASVNMQNNEGFTALMRPSGYDHNEIAQLLLSHATGVDMHANKGWTALMHASINGHNAIVQQLLSHEASVDVHNHERWTALMLASRHGHHEIVQQLLSHKASVDMQDNNGWTALMQASFNGRYAIVQQLLSHKASVDMQNDEGVTALLMASYRGHHEIVQQLLSHKASVDMQDNNGWTALMMASNHGYNAIVQLLLSNKASVDMQINNGLTSLMYASYEGHIEIVKQLLSSKASVDIQTIYGFTALMLASCAEHSEIVKLLLSNNASESRDIWR